MPNCKRKPWQWLVAAAAGDTVENGRGCWWWGTQSKQNLWEPVMTQTWPQIWIINTKILTLSLNHTKYLIFSLMKPVHVKLSKMLMSTDHHEFLWNCHLGMPMFSLNPLEIWLQYSVQYLSRVCSDHLSQYLLYHSSQTEDTGNFPKSISRLWWLQNQDGGHRQHICIFNTLVGLVPTCLSLTWLGSPNHSLANMHYKFG